MRTVAHENLTSLGDEHRFRLSRVVVDQFEPIDRQVSFSGMGKRRIEAALYRRGRNVVAALLDAKRDTSRVRPARRQLLGLRD